MSITAKLDYGTSGATHIKALFVRQSDNYAYDATVGDGSYVAPGSVVLATALVAATEITTSGVYQATSSGADGTVPHDIWWWDAATATWANRMQVVGEYSLLTADSITAGAVMKLQTPRITTDIVTATSGDYAFDNLYIIGTSDGFYDTGSRVANVSLLISNCFVRTTWDTCFFGSSGAYVVDIRISDSAFLSNGPSGSIPENRALCLNNGIIVASDSTFIAQNSGVGGHAFAAEIYGSTEAFFSNCILEARDTTSSKVVGVYVPTGACDCHVTGGSIATSTPAVAVTAATSPTSFTIAALASQDVAFVYGVTGANAGKIGVVSDNVAGLLTVSGLSVTPTVGDTFSTDIAIWNNGSGTIYLQGVVYDHTKVLNTGGGRIIDLPIGTDAASALAASIADNTGAGVAAKGSAMALTSGERTTLAGAIEAALIDEADGRALLAAIVAKIEATDALLDVAVLAAIAAACKTKIEEAGGKLALTLTAATAASTNTTDLPALIEDSSGTKRFKAAALTQTPADEGSGPTADEIAVAVAMKILGTSTMTLKITTQGYVYAAREDGTPIYYTLGGTTYGSRADVEDIFGVENIKKWALLSGLDPESDAGKAEISHRIARGLTWATEDINNRLREGGYDPIPITAPGAAATLVILGATHCGIWLYENRGYVDFNQVTGAPEHRYGGKKKWLESYLEGIAARKIRLDAPHPSQWSNAPMAQQTPHHEHHGSPGGLGYGGGGMPYIG